ncbi:MAG: Rrf2 family transcriptional regulator [Chlorobi bacterium]|nr:Rrf2 family transcriptional regulator [Chlorobiota bacterium]
MPKVINFSNAMTIGMHSLIILAREKKPLNAIQLADRIGSTKFHVAKVLQRLVKDRLLSSMRGPTGGFSLLKDPSEITVFDIYSSIEGEIDYDECTHTNPVTPIDKCIRETIVKKMTHDFVNYMKDHTVADYM